MLNSCASGDALNIAGFQHGRISQAIFVFKPSTNDVADNFEIAMRVDVEALSGLNAILVQDTKAPKTVVLGVVIVRKGKCMIAVQPPVICMTPLICESKCDHINIVGVRYEFQG